MTENEDDQNAIADLLLIEHGLKLLQEKIKAQIGSVIYLDENETVKTFLKESYEVNLNRTNKLLKETTNNILSY